MPSRTSKRILLVDQNAGHSKISTTTKGFAFKLNIPRCPRKALPSNVFLKVGLSKTSTKDFVHKLAFLSCPRKACLQGLQKEYYRLTKSALLRASVPRYPRKALPSNVFLRAGLAKASTKDFVHKLASLNYPRKVRLGGLLKEYDWLTKMVAIPKYPRKALPSNWISSNVHERLCLQMYF